MQYDGVFLIWRVIFVLSTKRLCPCRAGWLVTVGKAKTGKESWNLGGKQDCTDSRLRASLCISQALSGFIRLYRPCLGNYPPSPACERLYLFYLFLKVLLWANLWPCTLQVSKIINIWNGWPVFRKIMFVFWRFQSKLKL